MADLIDRQAAIDEIEKYFGDLAIQGRFDILSIINNLPSAQSKQKKGKWEKMEKRLFHHDYKCSICGNGLDFTGVNAGRGDANYCPNCGARMEVEKDE